MFPDLDLSFLFCLFFVSFLGLSRFFWDIPDLLGDGPGIFPIRPFSLSRPKKSTYEEQSPIGAFFCPEIRAFMGFWGEISSTVSKVLSDREVLFKHKNGR